MKQDKQKKYLVYTGITLVMVFLGVVAVVTAWRLRQLAQVPVAPNVPQSQPQALVPTATPIPGLTGAECVTSFEVGANTCRGWCDEDSDCTTGYSCYLEGDAETGVCLSTTVDCKQSEQDSNCECPEMGAVTCQSKTAYRDVSGNTPGNYDISDSNELDANATVSPGDKIVYAVVLTSGDSSGHAKTEDQLPTSLTFLDAEGDCAESSAGSNKVVCDYTGTLPKTLAYRVEVKENIAADVEVKNTVTVIDDNADETTCDEMIKVKVTPENTPTPGPTSSPTPTTPAATSTPPPGATATPRPTTTPQPGVTTAPTPVPTVVPPDLPTAGMTIPTLGVIALGGVLLLAGLTGLLVW